MHASPNSRDKVSNGRLLPKSVDLRSAAGRRYRYLVGSYEAELGGELSEAERSLVRQAVALQLKSEQLQEAIVRGEAVDSDQLIRISSTSKRLLSIIASKAGKRKPVIPTLAEYLASKQAARAADAEAEEA